MGRTSRNKGKRGELELVHQLEALGFEGVHRAQQYCGSASSADVLGLFGHHPECKRTEALSLYRAMDQAIRDSAGTDNLPASFSPAFAKTLACYHAVGRLERTLSGL